MQPLKVPEGVVHHVTAILGDEGREWLASVPDRCADVARAWRLAQMGSPFPGGSASVVVPVQDEQRRRLVLKLAPRREWLESEFRALTHWRGEGAARVEAWSPGLGALLVEAVEPGTSLLEAQMTEEEECHVFAGVAGRLHRPGMEVAEGLPHLSAWLDVLGRSVPHAALRAEQARAHRVASRLMVRSDPVVLHGDLHHGNLVLSKSGDWLAIDPKGVLGPREAEPAAFLRNPRPRILAQEDAVEHLERRSSLVASALDLGPADVSGWAYALAVVAAVWAFEDEGDAEAVRWLRCARLLGKVSEGAAN